MKIREITDRLSGWSKEQIMAENELIKLINSVEKRVYDNLISHRDTEIECKTHNNVDEECMIPDEYADIYVHYILAEHYSRLYESERSAQHGSRFNELYCELGNYVVRTFPPKPCAKITI